LNLWRELNQWVFAIHHEGKLVYSQATSSADISPDANLIREIRIAIAQLSMQGIEVKPDKAIVWSNDTNTQTSELARVLTIRVDLSPRPAPSLPNPLSHLLPADVRAARRAARQRQSTIFTIAAVALFYFGTIGYFGFDLWKTHSTTQKLKKRAAIIAPARENFALHIAKWDELEYGIIRDCNTVDILHRISKCIPANSGLRLKVATVSAAEVILEGEAPQPQAVTQFSLNLKKSNELTNFRWDDASPRQSKLGWEFTFRASSSQTTP
jgi:hypothetical protein